MASNPIDDKNGLLNGCVSDEFSVAELRQNLRQRSNSLITSPVRRRFDESDLVQECFLQACHTLKDHPSAKPANFSAWMFTALKNRAIDLKRYCRRKKRDIRQEVSQIETEMVESKRNDSNDLLLGRWSVEELELAIAKLPERTRTVITMRIYGNMSYSEIGLQLCCSPGAARKVWSCGVSELRRILGAIADE